MEKEEKVQATYVMLSPYFFQDNKKVEFIAKHGQLWFVILLSICMTLFYLDRKDNCWVLYLPQVVFYSFFYVFQRSSNNKKCQLMLVVISNIFIPYTFYLTCFLKSTAKFVHYVQVLKVFIRASISLYPLILHVNFRKHYIKDLSSSKKVSSLNTVDFCLSLLFVVCFFIQIPLTEFFKVSFPLNAYPSFNNQALFTNSFNGVIASFWACLMIFEITVIVGLYIFVTNSNRSKRMTSLYEVEFDSNGRAYWIASHLMFSVFTVLKYRCSDWCCALGTSIGWNRPSVKPEELQELPLKPIAGLNV
uniref:Serpentine receptor class gamma n=1 Tax=Panagrellus redivivus TaxID=6233 RepID=A0A7E4VV09_PANRE